ASSTACSSRSNSSRLAWSIFAGVPRSTIIALLRAYLGRGGGSVRVGAPGANHRAHRAHRDPTNSTKSFLGGLVDRGGPDVVFADPHVPCPLMIRRPREDGGPATRAGTRAGFTRSTRS